MTGEKAGRFQSPSGLLRLASGSLELALAPTVGGSIARFDCVVEGGRIPILRGADGVPETALDAAGFPMVPYCNRIRDGRFDFRGREVAQAPNMQSDPSPLHGHGWLGAWEVVRASENEAKLSFVHQPGDWPWAYEAVQHFRLDPDGLTLRLGCRNTSAEPMPCGLGLHPYFLCGGDTRLDTAVEEVWTVDEDVLPVERIPAQGRYDLRDGPACSRDLDNGFGGWGGSARIYSPDLPCEILMSSPDARFFQLYSPASGGLFVAEPVTHANAALNEPEERWLELGLRVLEPRESMSVEMRIDVRKLSNRA